MAKYPMGGERQLLPAVLGRVIPTGGLPLDVGVVVLNVATSISLAHAVDRGQPVTHRVLTVTGAVNKPGNFFVPIGTPISWVIEQAGGLRNDAAMVLMGGPMMGVTMPDLSIPVIKGTSGITVLNNSE
jgi:electron transport complex protein RnfC